MYQKVQGFLTLNAGTMTSLPIVGTLKTQLDAKVNAILAAATLVSADITGFTVDKQAKRQDLKLKTLKLSTALVAHAAITDNFKLKEKCDETPSSIDYMRDNDFYTYAKLIATEASPIMASLAAYGVVAADLSNANTAAATYLSVIQAPRVQINERSRVLEDLELLFQDMDKFLKEKLDQVMKLFLATNISIYNGYTGARSIDQTGSASAPDYQGQVNPNQLVLVASLPYLDGRTFEVQNTGNIPLNFSLSTSDSSLSGSILTLAPGQVSTRMTSNLNIDVAAQYVLLQNTDPSQMASYKIWVVE